MLRNPAWTGLDATTCTSGRQKIRGLGALAIQAAAGEGTRCWISVGAVGTLRRTA